ncbi:MAG: hypothetical protein ABID45_01600 [Patescibacteria group bacterium]
MPNCKQCQNSFEIYPEDKAFYNRIDVPEPTLCFDCRQQRRYIWRNERTFYDRKCDLCKKPTVSIYSPNKPFKVYCQDCWWSDLWDPLDYGQDFDFNKPFFEQFKELQQKVPRIALVSKNSTNAQYANHSGDNKNVYLSSVIWYCENIYYSNWLMYSQDCFDCTYIYKNTQVCYELTTSRDCFHCQYSNLLFDCSDCFFSYDLRGCKNCFMCHNLRHKEYCISNKEHSKEEYERKMKEIDLGSHKQVEGFRKKYEDMVKKKAIHRNIIEKSENCSGNHIFLSKNCHNAFDINQMENCKYIVSSLEAKDCYDGYHFGFNSELLYEIHAVTNGYNCMFTHFSYDNQHLQYCDSCHDSHDLFGCVCMKKNPYSIFNKKYSEADYKKLKTKIIAHMRKTGEYGEYFPHKLSPFGYNETVGAFYMPLSKSEVLEKKWNWEDNIPGTFKNETLKTKDISDNIKNIKDDILEEVLVCEKCERNYKLIKEELEFYRKYDIPVPRWCSECRYLRRMKQRQPRKVWPTACNKCKKDILAPYSQNRGEKVYCEDCYRQEVY